MNKLNDVWKNQVVNEFDSTNDQLTLQIQDYERRRLQKLEREAKSQRKKLALKERYESFFEGIAPK